MTTNFIMGVYGKKGSGKSFFVDNFIKGFNRVIIIDTMSCFTNGTIIDSKELPKLIKKIKDDNIVEFNYIVRFNGININEKFEYINYLIYSSLENVLLVIDELHLYVTALKKSEYFNAIISTGRHKSLSVIGISQRPSNIPAMFTANCDYIAIFETTLKRDLEIFSSYKYCDTNQILTLEMFECYIVDLKNKTSFKYKV